MIQGDSLPSSRKGPPRMAHCRSRIVLALASVLLAGCSTLANIGTDLGVPASSAPTDRLAPAPAPIYAAGDLFIYSENGQATEERVVSVAPDRVVWTNDSGLIWTRDNALVTPQRRWSSHPELGRGQQTIIGSPEQLFPLQEGNVIAYSVRGSAENAPAGWQEEHRCAVGPQEDVQVPAGTYTTFRIDCQRKDFLDTYYYSPVVQNYVLRVRDFGNGVARKELLSVTLANERTRDLPATVAASPSPVVGPTGAAPTPPVAIVSPDEAPTMTPGTEGEMMAPGLGDRAGTLITRLEDVVARLEKVAGMESMKDAMQKREGGDSMAGAGASSGSWAVHLASYRSQRGAQNGWRVLSNRFPALKDKRLVTSEFDPGNGRGTFVRLMAAGFASRNEANQFCRPIKSSGQFCQARGPLP